MIEADLHQRCHSFNPNKKIAKFINQSLTPLVVGLVFSESRLVVDQRIVLKSFFYQIYE